MKTVFSTKNLKVATRFRAWQEAICEHYLKVDVTSQNPANYEGFINKAVLGPVIITDVFLSSQDITRNRQHLSHLDKECFYIMFPSRGSLLVEQARKQKISTLGTAVLFDAAEPYRLRCRDHCQSMYIEMPRQLLADRCSIDKLSQVPSLDFADGLGWALTVFCKLIASESAESLRNDVATKVAGEIADLLSLYINAELDHKPTGKNLSSKFRLRSIQGYIESRLDDPDLSPGTIATENGISLRYLHYLFKNSDTSVSEWVREQRLKRCHQKLTSAKFERDSITDIAFSMGFNSSSHFTRLFKQRFGMAPRNAREIVKK